MRETKLLYQEEWWSVSDEPFLLNLDNSDIPILLIKRLEAREN